MDRCNVRVSQIPLEFPTVCVPGLYCRAFVCAIARILSGVNVGVGLCLELPSHAMRHTSERRIACFVFFIIHARLYVVV